MSRISLTILTSCAAYSAAAQKHFLANDVAGGQLWERVEAGRFSEAQAARIIREILQLLAQAHSKNIVIRDIKPDNLLFLDHSKNAPLKAIDFGIATVCTPDDVLEERCGETLSCTPACQWLLPLVIIFPQPMMHSHCDMITVKTALHVQTLQLQCMASFPLQLICKCVDCVLPT